jgi:hypothetical protein
VSLKTRVWRLLGKFDRRVTLVESAVDRVEGAVNNLLVIGAELRAAAANMRATAERLERAVAELSDTVQNDVLRAMADERQIRAGLGQEVMRLSGRVDTVERGPRGAAE